MATWVVPVLLLMAAWQIWDANEARRVEQALAPILGAPVPTEIRGPGTDDGAGRYYAAASIIAVSLSPRERIQATPGGPIVDAATSIRDTLQRGEVPTREALDIASDQIEQGRGVFDLVARASGLPFKGFSPGTEFNYRFSGLIDINRLAGLMTMSLALRGEGDSAARMLVDRLRSLRAFDEQRSIDHTVRARLAQEIATDVGILVARARAADERLSELDRALSEVQTSDVVERAVQGEALWWHQALRSMWEGRGHQGIVIIGPLLRPLLRHHAVLRLQTASDALAAARLPWPDRISAMNKITERRTIVPEILPYVAAWRAVPVARDQTVRLAEAVAAVRCARLVIGIERYRRARGRLPSALSDITGPVGEQALDPFTGKSLLYSHTGAGYVIYSVGRNGHDDGGTLAPDLPRGRLSGTLSTPDVGVRVMRSPAR
jgi:hypothetical protein